LLLFELARRGRSALVGLVPAAVVLFNGLQLWTEHAPLSDPLFTFLTAAILLVTVRSRDGDARLLVLLGVLLAAATAVRTVGLLLVPLVGVWLLCAIPGDLRHRLMRTAIPLGAGVGLIVAYMAVQNDRSGVFGFTESDGRIAYAIAAPFADCSKFTPPAGTRGLCQSAPASRRGSFNQYLWGFPDHAQQLAPGGRAAFSPAWRVFGPMPNGSGQLSAFGRAAILHQPIAYAREVVRNFSYYWRASPATFLRTATRLDPSNERIAAGYYSGGAGKTETGFGALSWYARHIEVDGALIVILLIGSLLPLAGPNSAARLVGLLCSAAGWLLLGGAALVAVDNRYALPALGPLAAATSIGVVGLRERVRPASPA
jgi:4-amino-4-deoxy-L-arabinose transferase-like glycosyltransferase